MNIVKPKINDNAVIAAIMREKIFLIFMSAQLLSLDFYVAERGCA